MNLGQHLYIVSRDITGDGREEIFVGGRRYGSIAGNVTVDGGLTGIKWIEAPAPGADQRNLDLYNTFDIDPEPHVEGSHGFQFADFDGDGDEDIAVCNSDWDTPWEQKRVVWYENPGTDSPDLRAPWTRRTIYQSSQFWEKPQVNHSRQFCGRFHQRHLL